jgi:hypothetical protein
MFFKSSLSDIVAENVTWGLDSGGSTEKLAALRHNPDRLEAHLPQATSAPFVYGKKHHMPAGGAIVKQRYEYNQGWDVT